MSTEDSATEDNGHCHAAAEQLFTSGSTTLERQITEDNKVRSPLMRLPSEIRAIILRMVVGDKLININTRETICSRTWEPEELDERNWTLARNLPAGDWDSNDDPVDDYANDRWGHYLNVLNTSHQLHREAFPIFWRTCQFRFWEKTALTRFTDRLGEVQRANLRRLVIMSDVEHSYDWNFTHGQDSWELCYNNILEELPLKRVCDIVLHLRISGEPWTDATIADRKASAIKTFEPFEHLRLLAPKKAKVEIFVPTISSQFIDEQILDKEMACLKDTFVKRLLDPKITKADLVDALTKRITRLEWSKGKAQTFAERNENQAVECLMVAKRARAGVEANRAAIKDLKAALQRDDEEEMERLAMPEELDE